MLSNRDCDISSFTEPLTAHRALLQIDQFTRYTTEQGTIIHQALLQIDHFTMYTRKQGIITHDKI